MSHERPVEPFSDVHFEHGKVRAVLLHDPTVEGLDMAIYMDASGSMQASYEYKSRRTFLQWLTGKPGTPLPNEVEPEVHRMLEYLAVKDRNGLLRVAYWACGSNGAGVEAIGELAGKDVANYRFPGPPQLGSHTNLAPALRDYVAYLKTQVPLGAKRGCAVIITDGQLNDAEEVKKVTNELAKLMTTGRIPRINFVLVGVGDNIDEAQLESIAHAEYRGLGHIWCHRVAKEIRQIPELVAVLVDDTMTVAAGGTIYDDKGQVVKTYEGRLPAVLEFDLHEEARSFTLEINGQRYTQPLPEEHHDEDEDDEDHH